MGKTIIHQTSAHKGDQYCTGLNDNEGIRQV